MALPFHWRLGCCLHRIEGSEAVFRGFGKLRQIQWKRGYPHEPNDPRPPLASGGSTELGGAGAAGGGPAQRVFFAGAKRGGGSFSGSAPSAAPAGGTASGSAASAISTAGKIGDCAFAAQGAGKRGRDGEFHTRKTVFGAVFGGSAFAGGPSFSADPGGSGTAADFGGGLYPLFVTVLPKTPGTRYRPAQASVGAKV